MTAQYTRQNTAVTSLGNAKALAVSQHPIVASPLGRRPMAGGSSHPCGPLHPPDGRTAISPKGGIFLCLNVSKKEGKVIVDVGLFLRPLLTPQAANEGSAVLCGLSDRAPPLCGKGAPHNVISSKY
jgi:hypothetical protein